MWPWLGPSVTRYDTLSTSGFVDGITFSQHGANEPESSLTLYFHNVHQLAAPVGRQTTSVWLSSSERGTGIKAIYAIYDCLV